MVFVLSFQNVQRLEVKNEGCVRVRVCVCETVCACVVDAILSRFGFESPFYEDFRVKQSSSRRFEDVRKNKTKRIGQCLATGFSRWRISVKR